MLLFFYPSFLSNNSSVREWLNVYQFVSGIGYYTAVSLASRNARVILACRNTEAAAAAAAEMRMQTGNENIVVRELDLSLLKSVRKFASVILEQESRLDILVNNAGTAGIVTSWILNDCNELCLKFKPVWPIVSFYCHY